MKRKREGDEDLEEKSLRKKQKLIEPSKINVQPKDINEEEYLLISIEYKDLFDDFKGSNVFFEINHGERNIFKYKPQRMNENTFSLVVDLVGVFVTLRPNLFNDFGISYVAPELFTPSYLSQKIRQKIGPFSKNKNLVRNLIKKEKVFPNFSLKVEVKDFKSDELFHNSSHDMLITIY